MLTEVQGCADADGSLGLIGLIGFEHSSAGDSSVCTLAYYKTPIFSTAASFPSHAQTGLFEYEEKFCVAQFFLLIERKELEIPLPRSCSRLG